MRARWFFLCIIALLLIGLSFPAKSASAATAAKASDVPCIPFLTCPSDSSKDKDEKLPEKYKDMVTVYGKITPASVAKILDRLHEVDSKDSADPILMLIDSGGGSVEAGLKVVTAMESTKRPVNTVIIGEAASMAAAIFEHGKKRLMLPRTTLMFHTASDVEMGDINRMLQRMNNVLREVERMDRESAARTGGKVSFEQLRAKEMYEWWLDEDEAISSGLADGKTSLKDYPAPKDDD